MKFIYVNWKHLLESMNQNWFLTVNLERFAQSISSKGGPLKNCFGFVDGTVRRVCWPGINQRMLYNGHKKVHSIKFQSVSAPNGLVINLYGPVEGRRHNSTMLAMSGLFPMLQQYGRAPNGRKLCIYGDPAYPLRRQL